MICLPFLCALVLYAETVRTNPINIRPACAAWEMEKCEQQEIVETDLVKRRLTIFDPKTGELNQAIKLYHQVCLTDDPWDSVCESFVGEQFVEY